MISLGAPGLRRLAVFPADLGWQRHQDRLDPPVGAQAEHGPAIVEEIELDVAALTDRLPTPFPLTPAVVASPFDDREVSAEDAVADVAQEREHRLGVGFPRGRRAEAACPAVASAPAPR